MQYCVHEDVGALLQLSFTATSKPNDTKVTDIIAMLSSEVNLTLRSVGVTPPESGELFDLCKLKVSIGSAGVVALVTYGNTDSVESSQGAYYKEEYSNFIKDIRENSKYYQSMSSRMTVGTNVTDGYTDPSVLDERLGDDWTA